MKICTKCKEQKPLSEFHTVANKKDKKRSWCKNCHNSYNRVRFRINKERRNEVRREWLKIPENRERQRQHQRLYDARKYLELKKDPEKHRIKMRSCALRKHGMTIEDWENMFSNQGRICASCKTDTPGKKGWCVDHCHDTGIVRGIICQNCNFIIGISEESPAKLKMIIKYIEKTSQIKLPLINHNYKSVAHLYYKKAK